MSDVHVREEGRGRSLAAYQPLFALAVVSLLAALAIGGGFGAMTAEGVMRAYMGVFLTVFALLKLFDLDGFANGFEMYDLLGRRSRAYALPIRSSSWGWRSGGSPASRRRRRPSSPSPSSCSARRG